MYYHNPWPVIKWTGLMIIRFIEENNFYKNEQKKVQQNQRMPPGMASQDLMAYWGTSLYIYSLFGVTDKPRLQI